MKVRMTGTMVILLLLGGGISQLGGPRADERTARAGAAQAPPHGLVVGCSAPRIVSAPHPSWRRGSVIAGPAAILGLRGYAKAPRATFDPVADGRFPAVRAAVQVMGDRDVTIAIPKGHRDHAGLVYDGLLWSRSPAGGYRTSEGHDVVRFEACAPIRCRPRPQRCGNPYTTYGGTIIVGRARCLPLDFYIEGRQRPIRRVVSFAAGDCAE